MRTKPKVPLRSAHLLEHFFGGNPPVHQPHPPRTSILRFDLGQKTRGASCGPTCCPSSLRRPAENFPASPPRQSPPVGRRSGGPGCSRAGPWESPLPRPPCMCSSGQTRGCQSAPETVRASAAAGQGGLILQNPIQAAIQPVFLRHREAGSQQIPHGTLIKSLPVQSRLAARPDQPAYHQHLQHLRPRNFLSAQPPARFPKRL